MVLYFTRLWTAETPSFFALTFFDGTVQDSGSGSLEGGPHFLDRGGGGFKRKEKKGRKGGWGWRGKGKEKYKSGRKKRNKKGRRNERDRKKKKEKEKRKTKKGPHRGFFSWVGRSFFLFPLFLFLFFMQKNLNFLCPGKAHKRRFAAGGHISEGGPSKQHEG